MMTRMMRVKGDGVDCCGGDEDPTLTSQNGQQPILYDNYEETGNDDDTVMTMTITITMMIMAMMMMMMMMMARG